MGKADLDPRVVAKSRFVCVSVAYAFQESYSVPRPAVEPRWAAHVSALPVAASGGVVSAAHDFADKGRATLCRSWHPHPEHCPDRAPSVYPDAPKRSGPLGLRNASVPLNRRTARLGALHLCAGCGRMGAHWKSSTQPRPPCGSGVLISAPVLNRARCATWKATAFASSDKLKRIIGTAERRRRRPDMCLATPVVTGGGNV